jgi:hypothetical protein
MEGVAAVGAGRLHVISFGVVPQALPNFLSYVLLRFESDIRSASVIGMVGGGGIGFYLWDEALGDDAPRDVRGRTLEPGQRVTWTEYVACGLCRECIDLALPQKCARGRK